MSDDQVKSIHNRLKNATVKIWVAGEFQGTGFFISKDGYLLTAYHCIGECPTEIFVKDRFDEEFPAILHEDKSLKLKVFDIAVLKVEGYTPRCYLPLGLVNKSQVSGDLFIATGYPAADISDNKDVKIYISNISGFRGENLEVPNAIKGKGQSGGPVYHNKTRRVIGLASRKWNEGYLTDTGLAVRFDGLFQKWHGLGDMNEATAKSWDESLYPRHVSQEQLEKIKSLLGSVNLQENDLKAICRSCVPEYSSLPACEPNNTLNSLLDWLAQTGQLSTGKVPILEFVARLIPCIENPDIKNRVWEWVKQVSQNPAFADVKIAALSEEKSKPDKAELSSKPLYLLIKLYPKAKKSDAYGLEAWLFRKDKCLRNVYAEDESFMLNTIPEVIEGLLEKIDDYLVSVCDPLTMEFFLPCHLLNHDVDFWGEDDEFPIGIDYRVVVRSLERLENKKWLRRWCRYWNKYKNVLQTISDSCIKEIDENTDNLNLRSLLESGIIAFRLISPPEEHFLKGLVQDGTPIALWFRQESQCAITEELQEYLRQDKLEALPELIRQMRLNKLDKKSKCHTVHISVLWDDPERVPPKPGFGRNAASL